MIPASCQNCATPSPSPASSVKQDGGLNLGAVFGVLGGMALTAVIVFMLVPCVRRRQAHRDRLVDTENSMRSTSGWGIGSRKSPSFRHHQERKTGRDVKLPLLPEVSTFTWSDLRSQNTSAGSVGAGDRDVADVYSFPTNNATLSHLNLQDGLHHHITDPYSVLGGPGGSAFASGSANVSPSAKRSVNCRGLYSNTPSFRDPYDTVEGSTKLHTNPIPRVSLPPAPDATLSRTNFYKPGIEMEPGLGQYAVKANSGSRPGSLQLPSPPASPPFPPQSSSASLVRSPSRGSSHSRSQSQSSQQADWRFNTSRTRPSLSSAHSSPATTALPFRPTSGSGPTQSWSPPVATNLNFTHSPPRSPPASQASPVHLTAAFRSSLHRSSSHSTATNSELGRYPSSSASSPPPIPEAEAWAPSSRIRSGSVVSERPSRPHGGRPRPVEMLRQESSGSDVRSGRRASMSAAPLSVGNDLSLGEHASRRAHMRSSVSLQTPQVEEANTPHGQSAAISYFESRSRSTSRAPDAGLPSGHTTSRAPSSVRGGVGASARTPLEAELASFSLSPSRRSSVSQAYAPSVSPRSTQPALVRKKDSTALKPIPVSALLHSPPHSSSRTSGSLSVPVYAHGSRSRSGSIASVAPSREGSLYEGRQGRRDTARAIPSPYEPLPPMEFAKFGDYDDDDDVS